MRTFVAIEIPAPIRSRIRALLETLRPAAPKLRWSRPEGLHITLKFIGEVPPATAELVKRLLAALPPAGPLRIAIREAGFFPGGRKPRVLWLGVESGPGLRELAELIDAKLAALGIAPETREYRPHLTLARIDLPAHSAGLREALSRQGQLDLGAFTATEFFLYESKPARGGSIYTRLAGFPLHREQRNTARQGSMVNSA